MVRFPEEPGRDVGEAAAAGGDRLPGEKGPQVGGEGAMFSEGGDN